MTTDMMIVTGILWCLFLLSSAATSYIIITLALSEFLEKQILPLVALKEHQSPAVLHVKEEPKEEKRNHRRKEPLSKQEVEQLYEDLQRTH